MNASELRKVAKEAQENSYVKSRNETVYRIDKRIKSCAEVGKTKFVLSYNKYTENQYYNIQCFYIDKRIFKELKKYYKERGFGFRRNFFNKDIYITW